MRVFGEQPSLGTNRTENLISQLQIQQTKGMSVFHLLHVCDVCCVITRMATRSNSNSAYNFQQNQQHKHALMVAKLHAFYAQWAPQMIPNVNSVANNFRNREPQLNKKLRRQYGYDLTFVQVWDASEQSSTTNYGSCTKVPYALTIPWAVVPPESKLTKCSAAVLGTRTSSVTSSVHTGPVWETMT